MMNDKNFTKFKELQNDYERLCKASENISEIEDVLRWGYVEVEPLKKKEIKDITTDDGIDVFDLVHFISERIYQQQIKIQTEAQTLLKISR